MSCDLATEWSAYIYLCIYVLARALGPSRAIPSKTFPVDTQIYETHIPPAQIHGVGATKNRLKGYFHEYGILRLENLTGGSL